MQKSKGFTLIELLVVITIIAVLSAIALVSYSTFLKNVRDAKRQSDVKFIQSALEQYHADQKFYPDQIISGESLSFGSKTYLAKIPAESQSPHPQYSYEARPANCDNDIVSTGKCSSYCLFVKLEGILPPSPVDLRCTSLPSGDYNYSVSKP